MNHEEFINLRTLNISTDKDFLEKSELLSAFSWMYDYVADNLSSLEFHIKLKSNGLPEALCKDLYKQGFQLKSITKFHYDFFVFFEKSYVKKRGVEE